MQERPVTQASKGPNVRKVDGRKLAGGARGISRHDIYAAESYFRRKRNSVPIAAMAWLAQLNTVIYTAVRAARATLSRWSTMASNTASWLRMRKG